MAETWKMKEGNVKLTLSISEDVRDFLHQTSTGRRTGSSKQIEAIVRRTKEFKQWQASKAESPTA